MLQEHLQQLLALQEVDAVIATAKRQQRRLPEQVAEELAALQEAERELAEAETAQEALEAKKRDKERDLAEQEEHRQRLKERVKGIANTREYQANIQEMDGVQRAVSTLEDEVLEALTEAETLAGTLTGLQARRNERRKVYKKERKKVDADLARLEEEVNTHLSDREQRSEQVDATVLRRYQRIAATQREALVPVRNGGCTGCNMSVPPQLVSEVKRGQRIHDCPHCHRLLYVPEEPIPAVN